jgi:hypothetical protein
MRRSHICDECDGSFETDNLWHFNDDGTVSEHWTGVIRGYTWRVENNKMIISFGSDLGSMEGTFSEDCQRIENGVYVGDFVRHDCWKAARKERIAARCENRR